MMDREVGLTLALVALVWLMWLPASYIVGDVRERRATRRRQRANTARLVAYLRARDDHTLTTAGLSDPPYDWYDRTRQQIAALPTVEDR